MRQYKLLPSTRIIELFGGVNWGHSLKNIKQAYSKAKYDLSILKTGDEAKRALFQLKLEEIDNALLSLFALRIVSRGLESTRRKEQFSDYDIEDEGKLKSIFQFVNQILYDRARRELGREKRSARDKGLPVTPWSEKEVRERANELRKRVFSKLGISESNYRERGIIEAALLRSW